MDYDKHLSAIKGAKVLMVGAVGIGCELLKILAFSGFQNIRIVSLFSSRISFVWLVYIINPMIYIRSCRSVSSPLSLSLSHPCLLSLPSSSSPPSDFPVKARHLKTPTPMRRHLTRPNRRRKRLGPPLSQSSVFVHFPAKVVRRLENPSPESSLPDIIERSWLVWGIEDLM